MSEPDPETVEREERPRAGIADCDRRIAKYHQLLDHDVDPALAASWITEAQRERRGFEAQLGQQIPGEQLSPGQVKALVESLRDIAGTLTEVGPTDKADLSRELGVTLRYDPSGTITVQAQPRGLTVRVGGASELNPECRLAADVVNGPCTRGPFAAAKTSPSGPRPAQHEHDDEGPTGEFGPPSPDRPRSARALELPNRSVS